MKIINSVVLSLIIGIFSFTNALEDLQSICMKNGGSEAVENLTKFTTNLSATCLPANPWTANIWLFPELAGICKESFTRCAVGLTDMAKICGKPNQRELFDVSHNAVAAANSFVCGNVKYIDEVYRSPDRDCPSTKVLAVINCFAKHLLGQDPQEFDQLPREVLHPSAILLSLEPDYNSKTCSNIQKFEQCGVEAMAECEEKGFSKLLESLFEHVNNYIPCENLSKGSKSNSKALSATVVNVLLSFYAVTAVTL